MTEKQSKRSTAESRKQRRAYGKAGDRLRHALKGDGIANAPKVSTLLLDTFVKRNGVLKAAHAEDKGLCDEVSFKVWRKGLEDLGWIVYDEKHARLSKRYTDHIAGYKLLPFINDAKAALAEFATMDDIRSLQVSKADRTELAELQGRVEALEKHLGTAQEEIVSVKDFAAKAYRALRRNARQLLGPNASEAAVDRLVNEMINAEDDENTPAVWPPLVAN